MYYIDDTNKHEHVYPTYGRRFDSYRWYKPLLAGLVFMIFYMIIMVIMVFCLTVVLGVASGSPDAISILENMELTYDTMDLADPVQSVMSLGSIVAMIPALALTALVVRDRPFSSYSSARGGWSNKIFWTLMPVAFVVKGLPIIIDELFINHNLSNFTVRFTLISFLVCTILGPLQCIAEEYVFRGLLMQTLGSWFRIPVIAVVLQAVIFTAAHPYNLTGKIAILISGLTFGIAAWMTRGIEASSALHVCNNMTAFYLQGLNLAKISSNVDVKSVVIDAVTGLIYLAVLYYMSRKGLFNVVKKDDAARVNAKIAEKKARKEAKAAAKAAAAGKHAKH